MRLIDADRLNEVLNINFGHTGGADVLRQLIDIQPTVQAVPIPENATNGGVMMLVFDSRYKDEYTSFVHLEVGNGYFIPIPKGWWNASYEGSDTE